MNTEQTMSGFASASNVSNFQEWAMANFGGVSDAAYGAWIQMMQQESAPASSTTARVSGLGTLLGAAVAQISPMAAVLADTVGSGIDYIHRNDSSTDANSGFFSPNGEGRDLLGVLTGGIAGWSTSAYKTFGVTPEDLQNKPGDSFSTLVKKWYLRPLGASTAGLSAIAGGMSNPYAASGSTLTG
jgi:hypothetical protein